VTATIQLQTTITFDRFGWSELSRQAREERLDLAALVARACAYYASELGGERPALIAPRLRPPPLERERRTLTIELDPECLRLLEREAERQELALARLLEHAALLYLADAESGRVAERIVRRAGE
jgi:hypothetical protein